MYLHELQSIINGNLFGDAIFDGIATHPDEVRAGNLFVCLEGKRHDGHEAALEAVQRGASCVVGNRLVATDAPQMVVADTRSALSRIAAHYYGVDVADLVLVGVTGTNGKTSVAYMLQRVFATAGLAAAYIGTLGVVADKLLLPPTLTTPDPQQLMPLLASLVERGVKYVFLEVSAHAAYWRKVAGLRFKAMVFTNLTQDHLDFFADMSEYANAKMQLFDLAYTSLGVINADDGWGQKILQARRIPLLSYGLDNPADVFAVNVRDEREGLRFVVNAYDMVLPIEADLHGRFNVYNVLAVAAVTGYLGVSPTFVCQALQHLSVPGRFNVVDVGEVRFVVDYAHTPDGLRNAIEAARTQTKGKLTVVFGCGGDRDKDKRHLMGRIASQLADYVYITNDNPRSESPASIIAGIEAGIEIDQNYSVILDRESAIREAYRTSGAGDCVLIAGKGAETTIEIGGAKVPYSDFDVLERLK